MLGSVIVFALTAVAGPGVPGPVAAPAATSAKKGQDPNRMICRTEEVTGSHLQSERRCMAAYQWKDYERRQKESVDLQQRNAMPPR
jgi:hypothetical protein